MTIRSRAGVPIGRCAFSSAASRISRARYSVPPFSRPDVRSRTGPAAGSPGMFPRARPRLLSGVRPSGRAPDEAAGAPRPEMPWTPRAAWRAFPSPSEPSTRVPLGRVQPPVPERDRAPVDQVVEVAPRREVGDLAFSRGPSNRRHEIRPGWARGTDPLEERLEALLPWLHVGRTRSRAYMNVSSGGPRDPAGLSQGRGLPGRGGHNPGLL